MLTEPQLLLILFTVAAVVALHLFLTRSRLGKAMRAMADNADLAQVSGINTEARGARHLDHRRRRSPPPAARCWRSTCR